MSPSFDKGTLELIASWTERMAVGFTFVGTASRIIFVFVTRPLRRIEAAEHEAQRKSEERARHLLELQVANAQESAAHAQKDAGDANNLAANASERAEELKMENLLTEEKLEAERQTRLDLEASLAPRILPYQIGPQGKTSFDDLKPFSGVEVIIEHVDDAEAERAANAIAQVIKLAGWKIVSLSARRERNIGFYDGVVVESRTSIPAPVSSGTVDVSKPAA
jgi:hypothetical protein